MQKKKKDQGSENSKNDNLKKLKRDITEDAEIRARFRANNSEAVHLRAGGKSRACQYQSTVEPKESDIVD
eukprot:13585383-Alexandrium_andersonii.AAC.1